MRNWKVTVQYDGADYSGWQIQPDRITVQEEIEKALAQVYNQPCSVEGSGRTDSGVHALGQVFSFREPRKSSFTEASFTRAFNSLLPGGVKLLQAEEASDDFHARFSAVGKTYIYLVERSQHFSPFMRHFCWNRRYKMDAGKAREVLNLFEGEHDFASYAVKSQDPKRSTIRTIYKATLEEWQGLWLIRFTGNGFLYKMVRSLAGQVIETASGISDASKVVRLLQAKDRLKIAQVAPAKGLFLGEVYYSQEEMNSRLETPASQIFNERFFK